MMLTDGKVGRVQVILLPVQAIVLPPAGV